MDNAITEIFNCHSANHFFSHLPPKSSISISCIHFNIRSLIKNFSALQQTIHQCNFPLDIIILTEVGISYNIAHLFNLPGYNLHAQLRTSQRGGGIIIYVRNHLKFTLHTNKTHTFENITGSIKLNSQNDVVVCAVYRPPSSNKLLFAKELSMHITKFDSKQNFLLAGDTNINLKMSSSYKDAYLTALSERGLMCGITDYTRIENTMNTMTKSCLDHYFARFPTLHPFAAVLDVKLADHRGIIFTCVNNSYPSAKCIRGGTRQLINYKVLNEELKRITWEKTNRMNNPDAILNFIYESFHNANTAATTSKIQPIKRAERFKVPWVDENINKLCNKRDKLFYNWKNSNNDATLKLEYNKVRNKVNRVLENKRNRYYIQNICNNFKNPKKIYSIINKMLGRVTQSIDTAILKAFEAQGINSKDIADNFANSFDKAVKDIIPNCNVQLTDTNTTNEQVDATIFFKKARPKDLYKIIKKLNTNKAPGADRIQVSNIKIINEQISASIADLVNCSVATGIYPDRLKVGCVRPVHKKGKKNDYSNYRPITLLSSIDKVVEKFVCQQIHEFYRKHDVIYNKQFGFQPGKSTSILLSGFTDEVNKFLNEKKQVLALFIDFSRAFDTLGHKQLVQRLDRCGIRGPLLVWCENYLKNRTFSVKIGNSQSEPKMVTEGTAQGSVLGPLHFLSYVNDMSKFISHSTCYQFADDTCLLIADKDPQLALKLLQSDFNALARWCHDAGLVLNANKTKLLHIKSPHIKRTSICNLVAHNHDCLHAGNLTSCTCPTIDTVDRHTYLGLIIDDKFGWVYHIEGVCSKLRQFLANITILKNRIPFKIKLMMYNALAESYIQYGLSSYGRTYKTYLDTIYRLQLRILKNIVSNNIKKNLSNNDIELFKHCKILPVHMQVKFVLLKEQYFNESLKKSVVHPVYTRAVSANRLLTQRANNAYGERTTSFLVPRLINNLPYDLRDSLTPTNFKYKLKEYCLSSC